MFVNSDFSDLLSVFNVRGVHYLVVGGYAVVQYGEPRYTKDLDLWIATNQENGQAVYAALKEFGAPLTDLTAADFAKAGYFYQMGSPPVRVDIMMGIPGVDFDHAWARRVEVQFENLRVNFISKEDLIAAKLASGRAQDLLDVESLGGTKPKVKPKRLTARKKHK